MGKHKSNIFYSDLGLETKAKIPNIIKIWNTSRLTMSEIGQAVGETPSVVKRIIATERQRFGHDAVSLRRNRSTAARARDIQQKVIDYRALGLPVADIAVALGVRASQVHSVRSELPPTPSLDHIDVSAIRGIAAREILKLRKDGLSDAQIAKKLGLGLSAVNDTFRKNASEEFSDFLRQHYRDKGYEWCARELGKPPHWVRVKASRLGVTKHTPRHNLSPEQVAFIDQHYKVQTAQWAADRLGISIRAVRQEWQRINRRNSSAKGRDKSDGKKARARPRKPD